MQKVYIIILHAFIGWVLCGAIIGVSFQFTTEQNALIIHAVGAPVFFGLVSRNYFRKYRYTSPFKTAFIFLGFVIFIDFFLVSMIIQKSFDMFGNILGTWIPFLLIFLVTCLVGIKVKKIT